MTAAPDSMVSPQQAAVDAALLVLSRWACPWKT
jgi:hypothetical protein